MLFEQRVRSTFPSFETEMVPCTLVNGVLASYIPVANQLLEGGDVMVDYITGSGPPWPFKPCTHTKWELERHIGFDPHVIYYTCRHSWANGRDTLVNRDLSMLGNEGGFDLTDLNSFVPQLVSFDDYRYTISKLIEECCETIEMPTDMLVFLAELRDIKSAWSFVEKKVKGLYKILSQRGFAIRLIRDFISEIKLKGKRTLVSRPVDTAANELLQYSFGVAPLVDEICKFYSLIGKFWDRYEDLIKGDGKPQKAHRVFSDLVYKGPEDEEPVSCIYAGDNATSSGHKNSVHRVYSWVAPKVAVTVYYRYALPDDWKSLGGKLGYALKSLGIQPSLGTVWELIPFSFVLDWFIPIGDILYKVNLDPSLIKVEILDVCASVSHGQHVQFIGNKYCNGLINTPLVSVLRSDYDRRVGVELKNSLPPLRMPKNFQWLLGAALVWVNKGKSPVATSYY